MLLSQIKYLTAHTFIDSCMCELWFESALEWVKMDPMASQKPLLENSASLTVFLRGTPTWREPQSGSNSRTLKPELIVTARKRRTSESRLTMLTCSYEPAVAVVVLVGRHCCCQ